MSGSRVTRLAANWPGPQSLRLRGRHIVRPASVPYGQARAALLLGIARRTLRVKLQDLGLCVTHSVEADEAEPL